MEARIDGWLDADRGTIGLTDEWADNFHLSKKANSLLKQACRLYAMEREKSRLEMIIDGSVMLRSLFLSEGSDGELILKVFGLSDANDDDMKDSYSYRLREIVNDSQPPFVIQSCEAWTATVENLDEVKDRRVSDFPDKKEAVITAMYANIYGSILTIQSLREVARNEETGKVIEVKDCDLLITHGKDTTGGRLTPFSDLLPELA